MFKNFAFRWGSILVAGYSIANAQAANNELNWDFGPSRFIARDQICSLPYRSLEDIIALQNGVVSMRDRDGLFSASEIELHVRGGRDYENGFYLNGTNVVDPITGVYTANFSTKAFDRIEFFSGGFPAQYGNANSSIINMSTISGGDKISGYAEVFSDREIGSDFGKNQYVFSLGGPITKSENLTFFGLAERSEFDERYPSPITDDALPGNSKRLPNNWMEGWTYNGKLTYEPNDRMKLSALVDGSNQEWSEYLHSYLFNAIHTPYHKDDNLAVGGSFNHVLIPDKTSYTLGASIFRSERFQGDGVYRDDLWAYGRPGGNYGNDPFNLFYQSDIDSTPVVTDTLTVEGQLRTFIMSGDEGHVFANYVKHEAGVFTINGSIRNKFSEWHRASLGLEFKRSSIRYYQHLFPTSVWRGTIGNGFLDVINYGYDDFGAEADNPNWENEAKHPTNISGFLENKFTLGELEISPSIRIDRWDVDALKLRNPGLPLDPDSNFSDADTTNDAFNQTLELGDLEKVEPITKLSPQLSIRANLRDKTFIFTGFGIRYQMPPYIYLYNDYEYLAYKIDVGGYFVPHGNSDLKPEKSTQVELGISHRFNPHIEVSIGGFLKWGRDKIHLYSQSSRPTSYATYRNYEEADIQGLDVQVKLKGGKNASFDLRYSLSEANGTGSYPSSIYNYAWTNTPAPPGAPSLGYDERHKLAGILKFDYRGEEKYNSRIQALDDLLFTTVVKYDSRLPYTPIQITNEATIGAFSPIAIDSRNTRRAADRLSIDLHIERSLFVGSFQITPFVTATNMLDKKNVADVWNTTGQPNTTGWLKTPEGQQWVQTMSTLDYTGLTGEQKYRIKENMPWHYYAPREFFIGVKAAFY